MTEITDDGVSLKRRFNHDILVEQEDQDEAVRRWPAIGHLLINAELIRRFKPHEELARTQKRIVQTLGSAAVLLMLAALLGYVAELWVVAPGRGRDIPYLGVLSELSALAALLLALLASRYGPVRRRWLKNRFITEVLRQWHFRRLLDGVTIDQSVDKLDPFLKGRFGDLSTLIQSLAGTVGQKMDELSELRRDPLGRIPRARLPQTGEMRAQLLDAYRALRLDHQRDFAVYKLSAEDKTFGGISLRLLSSVTEHLAGTTLVLALACSVARLFVPFAWSPMAAVSLAITGVAVRAWRDGFALGPEHERYQEMLHVLELLAARWENAESEEQRFRIAEELEAAALEELRSFIRSHEQAQFLF